MKNFLFKISLLCLMAAVFSGCEPQGSGVGNFNPELKDVAQDYVDVTITAPSAVEMAYVIETEPQMLTAPILFMTGKTITVSPGQTVRLSNNLQSETTYYLYAAVKLDGQNYSEVIEREFTTKAYEFDRLLTVVQTKLDGYKVHITVPEDVKEKGHVIRYGATDGFTYNIIKNDSFMGDVTTYVVNSIVATGNRHGDYVKNDSTLLYDDSTIYMLDENGDPVVDDAGDLVLEHNPITPGEPIVFMAGECRLGTDEEMGAIVGWYYGATDKSYQVPIFDWSTVDPDFDWKNTDRDDWTGSGWTGAFQKLVFKTPAPSLCKETVNIDIPDNEVLVTDATIHFDMDEGVSRYFYMILDNATYNQVVDTFLDKKGESEEEINDAFRCFLSSYAAFQYFLIGAENESIEVSASTSFSAGHLEGETLYHVLCTVHVDDPNLEGKAENAASQRFIHKTFTTKEKQLDPPVITVTPVRTTDPYNATFNIKAPNKDLIGAYWACNYSRAFELEFNAGKTYESLLNGNYNINLFDTEDVKALDKINSDEGFEISFPTLDGETMRFAIYGCNAEFTFNSIDEETEGMGWADYDAPMAEPLPSIDSPLYEALAGDWTATATILIQQDGASRQMTHNSKVTISNDIPYLPEQLKEADYALYSSKSRDEVDGMYEELLMLADRFAEYRLAGQNSMLCTGFIDFDYYAESRINYQSPYDLFIHPKYSSIDVPQLIYDFGPKWFLQLQEDGSVIVPMNSEYLPPMHAWPGYPYYVGAYGVDKEGTAYAFYDGNEKVTGFPVEIASDYSKITIKPIVLEDGTPYYMNALGVSGSTSGSVEIVATVLTEIVLTKGWTEPKANNVEKSAIAPAKTTAKVLGGAEAPKVRVYGSITDLKAAPAKKYKVDETPNIVTEEMVNQAKEKILKKYNLR